MAEHVLMGWPADEYAAHQKAIAQESLGAELRQAEGWFNCATHFHNLARLDRAVMVTVGCLDAELGEAV